jgi:tRNA pseudouridine55 synthase
MDVEDVITRTSGHQGLTAEDFLAGKVLLIDKPYEWTSFDVVKKIRNRLKIKKIGHAGTLDPLATGLLILCTGKKTKQIEAIQQLQKQYTGTMELGKVTPSYDLETPVEEVANPFHLQETELQQTLQQFTGRVTQVPPVYSAVKVEGKRAYDHARKGTDVKLKAREVQIDQFNLTDIEIPEAGFAVTCSKGTYIRSLIHDFGQEVGVGAYLSSLRRTAIGPFSVEEAYTPNDFLTAVVQPR